MICTARWRVGIALVLLLFLQVVADEEAEGGASADPRAYRDTHTFVYESGPEPPQGYRAFRAAAVSIPLGDLDATLTERDRREQTRLRLSIALAGMRAAGTAGADIAIMHESFSGLSPQRLGGQKEGGNESQDGVDVIEAISREAAAHSMYVVCPIKELVGRGAEEQVYNTAVLIGRDGGVIGRYRKRFSFWGFPEDPPPTGGHGGRRQQGTELEPPPVFDLDFGRVAILICFDINFNELWMHLAARGVDVVLWPSMYPAGELISALARVFKMHILSAVPLEFAKAQRFVDAAGKPVAGQVLESGGAQAYLVDVDLSVELVHLDSVNAVRAGFGPAKVGEGTDAVWVDPEERWLLARRMRAGKDVGRVGTSGLESTDARVENTAAGVRAGWREHRESLREYVARSRQQINGLRWHVMPWVDAHQDGCFLRFGPSGVQSQGLLGRPQLGGLSTSHRAGAGLWWGGAIGHGYARPRPVDDASGAQGSAGVGQNPSRGGWYGVDGWMHAQVQGFCEREGRHQLQAEGLGGNCCRKGGETKIDIAVSVPEYVDIRVGPLEQNITIDLGGDRGARCVCGWRAALRIRNRNRGRAPLKLRFLVQELGGAEEERHGRSVIFDLSSLPPGL